MASGHANGDEIGKMVHRIRSQVLIGRRVEVHEMDT
jgi:hypothetical protein